MVAFGGRGLPENMSLPFLPDGGRLNSYFLKNWNPQFLIQYADRLTKKANSEKLGWGFTILAGFFFLLELAGKQVLYEGESSFVRFIACS